MSTHNLLVERDFGVSANTVSGINAELRAIRSAASEPPIRPCPKCDSPTHQPEGNCDFCEGLIRPVCQVCLTPSPDKDWSAYDTPDRHPVPAGAFKGQTCPGIALSVAILT